MSLAMSNRYRVFTKALDGVGFDVFASTLIEEILEILILPGNGTS